MTENTASESAEKNAVKGEKYLYLNLNIDSLVLNLERNARCFI
jgi:hypothetical protein